MTELYRCDRCEAVFEENPYRLRQPKNQVKFIDLCRPCQEALLEWLVDGD